VLVSSTQLFVQAFDLTGVAQGTYDVSVTYTGGESNKLPLVIQGSKPTITTISPTRGIKGSTVTITINGANYDATTKAQITDGAGTTTTISTTLVNATQVTAGPLDLTPFAAANYGITAQNNGAFSSNAVGFVVDANDPTLTSVSPAGAKQDQAAVNLTLSGALFMSGVTATIAKGATTNPLPVTFVNATTLNVTGLNLTTYALGGWTIVVKNPGSTPSGGVVFTVSEGTPTLASANPASGSVSGVQPVTSTLTGTYFYPTSVVHASGGTITDTALVTTYVSATSVTASVDVSVATPGAYQIWVVNPGLPPLQSNKIGFTVNP
jgi:hypothetical protein